MSARADALARELNAQREAFKAFLTARVGDAAEAEDILQNGLLKAVQRAGELADDTKVRAWFYQLLRNAIVDHYRTRGARARRDGALGKLVAALGEDVAPAPAAWDAQICGCLGPIVDTLKPAHARLLRRVDLEGESVQAAAKALKLSPNLASVTLHRARKELRRRLESFCGACASNACLDCHCAPAPENERRV
jgi:RNA polymerase sigma-70 factor (ECF subfamily)